MPVPSETMTQQQWVDQQMTRTTHDMSGNAHPKDYESNQGCWASATHPLVGDFGGESVSVARDKVRAALERHWVLNQPAPVPIT